MPNSACLGFAGVIAALGLLGLHILGLGANILRIDAAGARYIAAHRYGCAALVEQGSAIVGRDLVRIDGRAVLQDDDVEVPPPRPSSRSSSHGLKPPLSGLEIRRDRRGGRSPLRSRFTRSWCRSTAPCRCGASSRTRPSACGRRWWRSGRRANRIGRGRAGAADDLQRSRVLHVDGRLLGDIELRRVAERGGEVRVAERDQAVRRNACVDSMMLTRLVSGSAQPNSPRRPGPASSQRETLRRVHHDGDVVAALAA
jgi:hypothetical protein